MLFLKSNALKISTERVQRLSVPEAAEYLPAISYGRASGNEFHKHLTEVRACNLANILNLVP